MENPRFSVGQTARLLQSVVNRGKSISCEILQIMPCEGICFQYRVKGEHERFERIAQEHELAEIIKLYAETTQLDLAEKFPSDPRRPMKGKE
jgi:hypothetical protein